MSRLRVACLVVLSALLLMDGSRPGEAAPYREVASPEQGVAGAGDAARPGRLDAAGVARIVGRANPELAPQERDRIGAAVMRFASPHGLAPDLVVAVILVESGGRPWARSPKGAMGLMQVMPEHTRRLGLVGNAATIESNIEAGCAVLAENIARFGEERGILAYFWGSDIRGDAYLERVQAARAGLRRRLAS